MRIQGPRQGEQDPWRRMFPQLFGQGLLSGPRGYLDIPTYASQWGANKYRPSAYRQALGEEYNWLLGGRAPTRGEIPQLAPMGNERWDPRFGTIGGMNIPSRPVPGRTPSPYASRDVSALNVPGGKGPPGGQVAGKLGFGSAVGSMTSAPGGFRGAVGDVLGRTQPQPLGLGSSTRRPGPVDQTIPPSAQYDMDVLGRLPHELLGQYGRVAQHGIYGMPGINTIYQTGIRPAQERTAAMPGQIMGSMRAAESQHRAAASRALGEKFGNRFAGQTGRIADYLASNVIGPSLEREAMMGATLQESATHALNKFDLMIGDLIKENMQSKQIGLQGAQGIGQWLQGRVGDRWWDTSFENKFGRLHPQDAAQLQLKMQKLAAAYGIEADKMATYWNAYYQNELEKAREEREEWWEKLLPVVGEGIQTYGEIKGKG